MSHVTSWEPGPFRGPTSGVSSIFFCVSSTVLHEDLPKEGYNQHGAFKCLCLAIQVERWILSLQSPRCSSVISSDVCIWSLEPRSFSCGTPPSGPREPEKGPAWNRMMHRWWEGPRRPGLVPSAPPQAWRMDPERLSYKGVRFQHYAVVLEHQIEKILPFQPSSLFPIQGI